MSPASAACWPASPRRPRRLRQRGDPSLQRVRRQRPHLRHRRVPRRLHQLVDHHPLDRPLDLGLVRRPRHRVEARSPRAYRSLHRVPAATDPARAAPPGARHARARGCWPRRAARQPPRASPRRRRHRCSGERARACCRTLRARRDQLQQRIGQRQRRRRQRAHQRTERGALLGGPMHGGTAPGRRHASHRCNGCHPARSPPPPPDSGDGDRAAPASPRSAPSACRA